ncbi:MAG: transcriptional regulator [Oscillibacter sp.]|nr:transcriptional regulator [Oscillibacter sp.]
MQRDSGKRVAQSPKSEKTPKPKKPGRLSKRQKWLLAGTIVLALALLGVVLWRTLFVRPDLPVKDDTVPTGVPDSHPEKEIDYGDGVRPKTGGERKSQDYYTVLILGRDTGGGGNTDTMLLASYDVTNQKATVMSIPRDTMVNVPWDIKRINSVYNYYGGGERGIQYLYKEISQLVGFEPDFQVVVEWEAVGKIVDAMGGVYFDVPRNMNYEDPYQDLKIHQTKGYRLLSGDDAMQVLRYRHDNNMRYGYPDGDLGRIKTQQALLKAMVSQLLQLKNISRVNQFAKVFQECVETDLSFQNILWFAQSAYLGGLKPENVNFVTMPNRAVYCWSRSVGNNQSYVVPIARELLNLVNNDLSPFVEKSSMSDLDIMSVNSDGSVSSSTGRVEDSRAAHPPVKPADEPEEPEEPEVDENGNPIDPETGLPLDPETGLPVDPNGGGAPIVIDPTNPGTGTEPGDLPGTEETPDPTTPDPGTDPGVTLPDPGVTDPGLTDPGATDPGAADPGPADPNLPAEPPSDPGFSIVEPPPEA